MAEAALRGVGKAAELIDLTHHTGAHPRVGATDVVPFIPIEGVTIDDCVALAKKVGREIWERYRIPVYFYEAAAERPERTNLENIRKGQFEGLREEEPVTDPGIRSTAREDLYVILAGWTDDGKATFKVLVNPLVMWIWVGGTVIVAGTVIAFWPDAREERRVPVRQALPVKGVEASHA